MKYLKRVKGVIRMGRIRNDQIRVELDTEPIQQKVKETNLKWFGHLMRTNDDRPSRCMWEARVLEKRNRERVQKTYIHTWP